MRGTVIGTLMLAAGLWAAGGGTGSADQSILTIHPYRWHGQWVFDDARVGLTHEPFVAGADKLIDQALAKKHLEHPEDGFLLWFSSRPFPGYDVHIRPSDGWLGPALLHYFPTPPADLYVRLGD